MVSKKRWAIRSGLVLFGICAVLGITYTVMRITTKSPLISPELRKQLSYGVYIPTQSGDYIIDRKSLSYSPPTQQLTYHVKQISGVDILLSMQPTPESFTDVPQVFDELMTKLRQYSSFDSVQGKVYLTHPVELNGKQSAVLNAKGTLMFAKPNKDLTDSEWKKFFNGLDLSVK